MAEPAILPAAQMERLAPASLASPCPRIPRARIARRCAQRWADLGCSSVPSSGRMNQLPQKNPLRPRPAGCSHSRMSSAESSSMDSFWMEVERIQQRDELREEDSGGNEGQLPEEGEAESQWLQDTGLSGLLGGLGLDGDHQELLSTLTQTQVAAVCRRLDIYTRSLRRRQKAPVRDVRDVFGVFNSGKMSSENGDSSMKWAQLSSGASKSPPAAEPGELLEQAGREEAFNMDSAYSEQAAVLLQRSSLSPGGASAWGKCSLPVSTLSRGRLGVTRIGDLSLQDMRKVPSLALIELTALCDNAGSWKWSTKLYIIEGNPLACTPLSDLSWETNTPAVPELNLRFSSPDRCLSCLEKRGAGQWKGLEQKLERDFYTGLFSWDEVHHNDASDLLKRFIRKLPTPLLTAEYLPAFAVVPNIPDLKQRLQVLHLLILILPEPNRNALKALLEFLRKVVAREQHNKMTLWNVSTVMAPNLFLHQGRPPKLPKGKEKQLAEGAAEVVQIMVHYQDLLWTVASFLVSQVRKLNDSSSRRPQLCDAGLKTWLRRMYADKDKAGDGLEATLKVAKIQVVWPIKDPLKVPLTPSTKVAHVLRQFTERLSPGSNGQQGSEDTDSLLLQSVESASILLYEVGGNINEHRLDPDAYLLDLYRANPHGEWVLKQSPT
uniref:Rho GTPase activating protein 40 n=1 Tax=Aotus nancymaae TaxID=37293 RepID=A0A2K5BYM1_AOTNA